MVEMFVVKSKILLFFIVSWQIFVEGHSRIPFLNEQSWLSRHDDYGSSHLVGKPAAEQPTKIFRLPDHFKPISYDLKMVPCLEGDFTFFGHINISLLVTKSTKNILMHSSRLNITSLEVYRGSQKIACNFTLLPNDEILSILSRRTLYRKNLVEVRIKFRGLLNDRLVGFYRSSYTVGNTTKWLATTQFEEFFARWAFPCFDEPKFRATFNITIARYRHQQAISNMPLKSTSAVDPSINNRVWDSFERTPPMPTYLVAFIVSEFKHRHGSDQRIRLWASENVIEETTYALEQASSLLKVLEKFMQVPYSLPKLDVVAVPTFSAGAMENWGLTTFRERYLLWNEKFDTESKKSLTTIIIAHEFSHMWFGDLVTVAWWDFLWLKEGFATYFQYFATALTEPSWRYDELFVVREVHFALRYDTNRIAGSPMTGKIRSVSDINWDFVFASYHKASCVIRMMEHVVSPATFKNALNLFLISRKNADGVADPSHLYDAFEKQLQKEHKFLPEGIKIASVFKKFADQVGYPCVTVSRINSRNGQKIDIEIKQQLYATKSSKKSPDTTWFVPLSCTKQSKLDFNRTEPTMWLSNASKIIVSNEVGDNEWYLCNIKQTGYYRVNYDLKNWQLLINQLHSAHTKIHPLNRAQLIEDCYTFANDGYLPLSVLFDLFRYLEFEVDPIPWLTSLNKLYDWSKQFEDTVVSSELKHFAKHLIEHYYNHVGFDEKPTDCHLTKIIRTSLTFVASILDIKDAVTKANAEFSKKTELRSMTLSVRDSVLCTAIRTNSSMTVWNRLWDLFRKSHDELEKPQVLRSFGCASSEDLLKKFIFKLVNESDRDIPEKLKGSVYCSVQQFQRGVTASLNFILDMIPQLGNYTKAYDVVLRLLKHMDDRIQSEEQIDLLDQIIEESKKLDQQKYGNIAIVSNSTKVEGLKNIKRNNEIAQKMFAVLGKKEQTTTTTQGETTTSSSVPEHTSPTPKPKPSLAPYIMPSAITLVLPYLFIAVNSW